jgi:hypothetical protein
MWRQCLEPGQCSTLLHGAGIRYKCGDDDRCEKDYKSLSPAERARYEPLSEPEHCVVIDAKLYGNVARFINHAEGLHANLTKCNMYVPPALRAPRPREPSQA